MSFNVPDPFMTDDADFDDPSSGFDKLATHDNVGRVMLILVKDFEKGITTRYSKVPGDTAAVDVDAFVFGWGTDGFTGDVTQYDGCRVFQRFIVGQLKPRVGKPPIVAVLSTRAADKGTAFVLDPATDEHKAFVRKWLSEQKAAAKASAPKPPEDPFAM